MAHQSSVRTDPQRPLAPARPAAGSMRHDLAVTDPAPHLDRLVRDLGRSSGRPTSWLRPGLWHS